VTSLRTPNRPEIGAPWPAGRALLVFAALAVFVFRDSVLFGRALFQRDIDGFWNGSVDALVRVVAAGSLPLWNPYPGFGQPFLAAAISQLAYPTTWLNLILPPATFYTLFVLLHVLLAAAGAYALARLLGASWLAGVLAGVLYAFAGPFLSAVHMANLLAAAAWLPWAFAGALGALVGRGRAFVPLWGVAIAMTVLAGSPEITLMACSGVVLALPELWRAQPAERWRALRAAALALVLGLGLSAVQWLPTLELHGRSARAGLGESDQVFWSLHPLGLVQALLPLRLDELPLKPAVRQQLFEGREPFLDSIYVGVPAAGLAVVGLILGLGRRRLLLAALAAAAALMALGRYSPLYEAARELLPLLERVRYPAKFIVLFGLCHALLAGLGLDAVRASGKRRRAAWLASALLLGSVSLAVLAAGRPASGLWRLLLVPAETFGRPWESSAAIVASRLAMTLVGVLGVIAAGLLARRASGTRALPGLAACLALLAAGDLLVGLSGLNPTVPRALLAFRSPALDPIPRQRPNRTLVLDYKDPRLRQRHLGRDSTLVVPFDATPEQLFLLPRAYPFGRLGQGQWGVESLSADVPLLRDRAAATLVLFLQTAPDAPYYLKLLRAAGVEYLVTLHGAGLPAGLVELKQTPGPMGEPIRTFRVPDPLPRAFVVTRARRGSGFEAWKTIVSEGFDPGKEVFVDDGVELSGDGGPGRVRAVAQQPDSLSFEVESPAPGYLVVLEGYDPGWTARVDGEPARVVRANAAFRGVLVPAGRHRVAMTYRPASVGIGLAVSLLTLAALLAAYVPRRRVAAQPA
jgi:hypothetical protein